MAKPTLSPSGRYVAAAGTVNDGRAALVVLDLENLQDAKIVASFLDADVDSFLWVNDQRLVLDVIDLKSGSAKWIAPGLWAVDRDGKGFRQLVEAGYDFISNASSGVVDRRLPWHWLLHSTLSDGSDDVLVESYSFGVDWTVRSTTLARLNTRTGRNTNLVAGTPASIRQWWVDSKGQPVAGWGSDKSRSTSYWRNAQGEWAVWQEGPSFVEDRPAPWWFGADGTVLALASEGDGTRALFQVDPKTRKLAQDPLVRLKGYDFSGSRVVDADSGKLLGIHYETDARSTIWFDRGLRSVQAAVDAQLPRTVNTLHCRRCEAVPTLLVEASSDRQPPSYFIYRRDTRQLTPLADSRPWIKPQQMGQRDMHRVSARDGLVMPVLVTTPAGKASAPLPAVVLVHGGPWVRGANWEWERHAQFLASRGYVVIEPEFRGSTGYGDKHFRAGWKQWGLAMQDDVADAVQWAVKQGLVDEQRVCIAGASYGGYATLMGLIKHPELYQCGFEWVGVSDIELMYSSLSDVGEAWKEYGMPVLVGDRDKDAAQLRATSPLQQAARLTRPLLMAHGGADMRVPIKHGRNFYDAVRKTNPNVEWVVYPDEGHGWRMLETNVDFWTRVEKFLDRHIGAGAAAKAGSQSPSTRKISSP